MGKDRARSSATNKAKADKKVKSSGTPPGTLIFTGKQHLEKLNVSLAQYDPNHYRCDFASNRIPDTIDLPGINWFDVRGVHDVALIEQLGKRYNMHPLAIEDVLNIQQRPKFEEYDDALFIVVRFLSFDPLKREIDAEQVALYVTADAVLSFQEKDSDLFAPIRKRLENASGRIRARGSDYLAYALIDAVVDNYFIALDKVEDALALLETEILAAASETTKALIHDLRISLITLRKSAGPMREAISRFSGSDHALINRETGFFLRDLYDHSIRIVELIETNRDLLNGLHDLYMSEISFKMNNVIQILTIISTIFIPLTFLAGVYGMNFDVLPELHWRYSYPALWAFMIVIVLWQLYYFRKKNWL